MYICMYKCMYICTYYEYINGPSKTASIGVFHGFCSNLRVCGLQLVHEEVEVLFVAHHFAEPNLCCALMLILLSRRLHLYRSGMGVQYRCTQNGSKWPYQLGKQIMTGTGSRRYTMVHRYTLIFWTNQSPISAKLSTKPQGFAAHCSAAQAKVYR